MSSTSRQEKLASAKRKVGIFTVYDLVCVFYLEIER